MIFSVLLSSVVILFCIVCYQAAVCTSDYMHKLLDLTYKAIVVNCIALDFALPMLLVMLFCKFFLSMHCYIEDVHVPDSKRM